MLSCHKIHPIITVGAPIAALAPHRQVSPTRNAGLPPIITVALPWGNALTVGTCQGGGIGHTWVSPTVAAGIPPISTIGTPGPVIVPPWVDKSVTLAAGGMVLYRLIYKDC